MFISDTGTYKQYLTDCEQLPEHSEETMDLLHMKANLGPEFREKLLRVNMMKSLQDFIYWTNHPQVRELMPEGKPLGFDLNTLDDLEEYYFHIFELQKSDGFSNEQEKHFAAKMISAYTAALLQYQFGFNYAYPNVLREGAAWAVGISFPSGHEFSFYAYFMRMLELLNGLRKAGDDPGKYNGLTKGFIQAMVRVETNGDLTQYELYKDWIEHLGLSDRRRAELFLKSEERLMGVSILAQEENADSAPMIFAYYCRDLLLDLFDGSLASYGRSLGQNLPVKRFRFSQWYALDELLVLKIKKMMNDGLLEDNVPSKWKTGEVFRLRLAGLLGASLNIEAPFERTFLYPKDGFNTWIMPFNHEEARQLGNNDDNMLNDEKAFAPAIFRVILNVVGADEHELVVGNQIEQAHARAIDRLQTIQRKHHSRNDIDRLSLAGVVNTELGNIILSPERPENLFATKRSLCYLISGELRKPDQQGAQFFQATVALSMDWVNGRLFFPSSHVENPGETFDSKRYMDNGLPSFTFDGAFKAQAISFPEQKKWFLRLYEPDHGVYLSDDEFLPGEPGRFVGHHISIWVDGNKLMSAFSTYVTHSYQSKNHYRGSCASLICLLRQNGLALRNGGLFDAKPIICLTPRDFRGIGAQLNQSLDVIPVIVCVYQEALDTVRNLRKQVDEFVSGIQKFGTSTVLPDIWEQWKETILAQEDAAWAKHDAQLKSIILLVKRCAYKARLILMPEEMLDRFCEASKLHPADNALSFFFGGSSEPQFVLALEDFISSPDEGANQILDAVIASYDGIDLIDRGFNYRRALEMKSAAEAERITESEQWQAYHESRINLLAETNVADVERTKRIHDKTTAQCQSEIQSLERKLSALSELHTEQVAITDRQEVTKKRIAVLEGELDIKNLRLEYLEGVLVRPQRFEEVEEWAVRRFSTIMTFLPRAVRELKLIQPNAYNLPLLCDCLEFLANEYCAELQGHISQDELNKRSGMKYGRLFTVTPNKSGVKGEYSEQYQVFWQGKKRNLDLHLKVGNTAPFLIRIYFYYDTNEEKIYIGSLPGHLDAGA